MPTNLQEDANEWRQEWGALDTYHAMRQGKNARAIPDGRAPKELWQMALDPRVADIPTRWQVAQTAQLDKYNGKNGL